MRKQIIAITVVLLFCFSLAVHAEEMTPSITVQGSGRVTVTPDLGTISFAVTEEGQEASKVQKVITENANAVKDAMFAAGLPEDQFKTSGIQLSPRYDYSSDVEQVVGYCGQISMSVNEIDLDDVGKYLQILSQNGVNEIDGISVYYSGYEDAYREALGQAMQQARLKAEALAEAESTTVTNRFSEAEQEKERSERAAAEKAEDSVRESADTGAGSLDFTVGTTEVEAVVTVCYEIDPD